MTVTAGTNSYASNAEADAYFATRYGFATTWAALTSGVQDQLLVTATNKIESLRLAGEKTDSGQALHFPATGLTDQYGDDVASDSIPTIIKQAEFELVIAIYNDSGVLTAASNADLTKRLKADTVEIEYFRPQFSTGPLPPAVMQLLGPYLAGSSNLAGPVAYGTGECSEFDGDEFTRSGGF